MKEIAEYAKKIVDVASQMSGLSEKDWTTLASVKTVTQPWGGEMGKLFGQTVYGQPELTELMSAYPRSDREQAISVWFERIASGAPGDSFWPETALIGMYHAAASVSNEHLMSFMTRMESGIYSRCIKTLPAPKNLEVFAAFQRVLGVARAVMVEAYDNAIITGVCQIGFNAKLISRMRTVAVRKMIDEGRNSLPLMVWDDALSVGVAEVDRQHKVLIDLLNLLHSSTTSGKGNDTLKKVLADLANYTVNHFDFEEKMLAQHGYPEFPQHKESHERLTAKVLHFKDEFDSGRGTLGVELFMFLRSWLNGHIRGSDRHYAKFLNAKGVR